MSLMELMIGIVLGIVGIELLIMFLKFLIRIFKIET